MNKPSYFRNPFRAYRAEQMSENIWRLFVKEPFNKLLGPKPLIYEGGRGSGKTMFFLCNSWKQQFEEHRSLEKNPKILFGPDNLIGFYYRVDAPFIGSFYGQDINEDVWSRVFSTYFNLVISKSIFHFLKYCSNLELIHENQLSNTYKLVSQKLNIKEDINDTNAIIEALNNTLDGIESFSNTQEKVPNILLSPGTLIKSIIENLKAIDCLKNANFHIFVDEFESLNKNQQIQLNTLLKMSQSWLVYDISVKSKGIKTYETITGEIIQDPHDFNHFRPESQISDFDYEQLLKKICEKRFKEYVLNADSAEEHSNIEFYLKKYDFLNDLERLKKNSKSFGFKNRIREIVFEQISDSTERDKYYFELAECDLLNARMHLCLLLRKNMTAEKLYSEYTNWKQGDSKKYDDWLHNMSLAVVFLLCRESGTQKLYNGFNVFKMLSSGIIRYFLELCEHAFDFAHQNGFNFEQPRVLSIDEQNKAAHYVSRYKIMDLEWFKPNGKFLKRFVTVLGQLFYELNTNQNTTLGEPEQNHFFTRISEVKAQTQELLDSALMHNVLQERLPTKEKESELPIETVDYHLNHIFCPYFEISYRIKRKLFIRPSQLDLLIFGNTAEAKDMARQIISAHIKSVSLSEEPAFLFGDNDVSG